MSELPHGIPAAEPPTPRLSAAGVVLRPRAGGGWEVLLGKRARGSRFMPGNLAFPGGRLDPEDRPDEAGALARCVSREFEEECGLSIPPGAWLAAGERTTPPMFPLRFQNAVFVAEAPPDWSLPAELPSPEEIEELRFDAAADVIATWQRGECMLPPPVLPVLRALAEHDGLALTELVVRIAEVNAQEERAPRIEFQPDVWMLPVATETLPPATHTNVWMPGGAQFVIIDPGSNDDRECERLLEVVGRRQALGQTAVAVLLTHGHRDHVGGALSIARALQLPLRASGPVLEALAPGDDIESLPLDEGELLELDGLTLRVLHTPGHDRGHLAFEIPERKLLIAGDLVSALSTILIDPEDGDMGDYLQSLRRVSTQNYEVLLPGHGPPVPPRIVRKLIQHRAQRESRIVDRLSSTPASLEEIARHAYPETTETPAILTERQTLSHLLHLKRQGKACPTEDGRWIEGAEDTPGRIEGILRARFRPRHFELRDDSAKHAGHAGASSGGGHYDLLIVADEFEGLSLLEQHRRVQDALRELYGNSIHALALKTLAPSRWP